MPTGIISLNKARVLISSKIDISEFNWLSNSIHHNNGDRIILLNYFLIDKCEIFLLKVLKEMMRELTQVDCGANNEILREFVELDQIEGCLCRPQIHT